MNYYAVVALLFFAFVAVVSAQVRYPPVAPQGDRYAASLAGAQVGTYQRVKNSGGAANGWRYRNSEVYGESLGNAKVGIYGNDRRRARRPLRG